MASSPLSQLLLLGLFIGVNAYSTFDSNCSVPTASVNFVSSPDSRGTMDIVWSSLFTILACTYTIQHLNVPEQRNGRDPRYMGTLKWNAKVFFTTASWMVVTIFAPEVLIDIAFRDFIAVRETRALLKTYVEEDGVAWTSTHYHYVNIGGFVIRSRVERDLSAIPYIKKGQDRPTATSSEPSLSEAAASRVGVDSTENFRGQAKASAPENPSAPLGKSEETHPANGAEKAEVDDSPLDYPDPYHVDAQAIFRLRGTGILSRLPSVTEEKLKDCSKSDSLVKGIAVAQILWSLIQVVARGARGLAISQLEIAVLAFSACALVVCALQWSKPKSVSSTRTILQCQGSIPMAVRNRVQRVLQTGFID